MEGGGGSYIYIGLHADCLPGCRGSDNALHKKGHHARCPHHGEMSSTPALAAGLHADCLPGCRGSDGKLHKKGHHTRCPHHGEATSTPAGAAEEGKKGKEGALTVQKGLSEKGLSEAKNQDGGRSSSSRLPPPEVRREEKTVCPVLYMLYCMLYVVCVLCTL